MAVEEGKRAKAKGAKGQTAVLVLSVGEEEEAKPEQVGPSRPDGVYSGLRSRRLSLGKLMAQWACRALLGVPIATAAWECVSFSWKRT